MFTLAHSRMMKYLLEHLSAEWITHHATAARDGLTKQ